MTNDVSMSEAEIEKLRVDAGLTNPPTQETYWYRKAMSGEGPHAFAWSDKPHRLIFDLCLMIEEAALRNLKEQPVAPEGWVLVPRKRTVEMHRAAQGTTGAVITHGHSDDIWAAMLAAAPKPDASPTPAVSRPDVIDALTELEAACDALAATRSSKTYLRMVDVDGASDALARLDPARQSARAALSSEPHHG